MTVRRAPWLITTGAITGFLGVIAFHMGGAAPIASASGPTSPGPSASSSSGPPGSQGHARTSGNGKRGAGRGRARTGGVRTATGPSVNFGYGTIAVRATVRGSRILAVSVASLSTLEPTSSQISGQAIPMLRQEVLSAQSVSIQGVSGATYTSQGYVNSLQAALNDLHV